MNTTDSASERYLVRLSADYLLRFLHELSEIFEGDLMLGIVFITVAMTSIAHLRLDDEVRPFEGDGVVPDELRRPVTVLSVAATLGLPRETVRRHVWQLIDRGYCIQVKGRRVLVNAEIMRRPDVSKGVAANRRHLKALVAAIRRADLMMTRTPA